MGPVAGMVLNAGTYPVQVGGGGQGFNNSGSQQPGTKGSDSQFNGLVAYGGGYGASGPGNRPGGPGGSGGGAGGGGGSPGGGGLHNNLAHLALLDLKDMVILVVLTLIRHLILDLAAVAQAAVEMLAVTLVRHLEVMDVLALILVDL